jgi:hypothetical protein
MNYLFYWIYTRQKNKLGENIYLSVLSGVLAVSLIVYLSLFDIYLIFRLIGFFQESSFSKVQIISVFFFLLVLNSMYYLIKKKYREIEHRFDNRSRELLKRYRILTVCYIAILVVCYFVFVNLLHR